MACLACAWLPCIESVWVVRVEASYPSRLAAPPLRHSPMWVMFQWPHEEVGQPVLLKVGYQMGGGFCPLADDIFVLGPACVQCIARFSYVQFPAFATVYDVDAVCLSPWDVPGQGVSIVSEAVSHCLECVGLSQRCRHWR